MDGWIDFRLFPCVCVRVSTREAPPPTGLAARLLDDDNNNNNNINDDIVLEQLRSYVADESSSLNQPEHTVRLFVTHSNLNETTFLEI